MKTSFEAANEITGISLVDHGGYSRLTVDRNVADVARLGSAWLSTELFVLRGQELGVSVKGSCNHAQSIIEISGSSRQKTIDMMVERLLNNLGSNLEVSQAGDPELEPETPN